MSDWAKCVLTGKTIKTSNRRR